MNQDISFALPPNGPVRGELDGVLMEIALHVPYHMTLDTIGLKVTYCLVALTRVGRMRETAFQSSHIALERISQQGQGCGIRSTATVRQALVRRTIHGDGDRSDGQNSNAPC